MSMTMTQKILAKHAGLESVVAGQLIEAKLDMVLGNDVTSPVAINEMTKFGKNSVFDKTRISLVMDHFTPNKDIQSAQNCKQVREFAKKYDIIVIHDNAYSEFIYDYEPGISFLSVDGAMDVGIEFNSLSKRSCTIGGSSSPYISCALL